MIDDDLPDDISRLAQALVRAGDFESVEEVIRTGVETVARRVQRQRDKLAALRVAVEDPWARASPTADSAQAVASLPDELPGGFEVA